MKAKAGNVNDKLLLKQFGADPGVAFLEVIRSASMPIDALKIKERMTSAGVKKADADDKWTRLQPHVNNHPHIRKPTSRSYEWSIEPTPSAEALHRLSAKTLKSVPGWLINALVTTVADSLAAAETSGPGAQSSWSEQRDLEKVQVLATIASQIEARVSKGQTAAELLEWIQDHAISKRLEPVAKVGEQVEFDPTLHDSLGGFPKRGSSVEVISSGYRWLSGDKPTVVVRAAVRI